MATPPPCPSIIAPLPPPSSSSSSSSSSSLAAAPPTTTTATTSTCTTEVARGTHVFHVHQYSLLKGLGAGRFVTSSAFRVGGYCWAVRLYPSGVAQAAGTKDDNQDLMAVYVKPVMRPNDIGADAEARARSDVRLVNQTTGRSHSLFYGARPPPCWVPVVGTDHAAAVCIRKSVLENSSFPYLRDDHLAIECVVTVMRQPHVTETRPLPWIEEPPPGLSGDLGALLEGKDGADVTLHVRGEPFPAHGAVLAARSPVFKAELRGPSKESESGHVTVEDMQPAVFRAFLHFVYTDTLPAMDDLDGDDRTEMLRLLLVAADRYAVGRLKRLCESLLCENLDARAVRTTLAVADQYHCDKLKEVCRQFMLAFISCVQQ